MHPSVALGLRSRTSPFRLTYKYIFLFRCVLHPLQNQIIQLSHRKPLDPDISPLRLLYPTNILPRHRVPRRHVLLHALRETRFFLFRKRAAWGRDAFVEAVHVEFLSKRQQEIYAGKLEKARFEEWMGNGVARKRNVRGGAHTAIS